PQKLLAAREIVRAPFSSVRTKTTTSICSGSLLRSDANHLDAAVAGSADGDRHAGSGRAREVLRAGGDVSRRTRVAGAGGGAGKHPRIDVQVVDGNARAGHAGKPGSALLIDRARTRCAVRGVGAASEKHAVDLLAGAVGGDVADARAGRKILVITGMVE